MSEREPALIMEDVVRSFDGRPVLRGVSGRVEAGKVVGLLGRNGEGKSTLLSILLDMLEPDSGRFEVLGRAPSGDGEIRQFVGFVPERPVFHDFMSVAEVLSFRSRFFRRWNPARAGALAKRLGLEPATRIAGASKGTLGKLAWVCAAAHDPELYLLDEPTSGLDALVRDEVLAALIGELSEAGRTVLVTSHHMEEMAGLLDEVWVMAGGRIAARHDADSLRREACLVTGRLREGARLPEGLTAVALSMDAPLVELAVFAEAEVARIAQSKCLEGFERAPLSLEASMKHLLRLEVSA